MAFNRYRGYSLRTRVFIGFMVVCFLSIIGSTAMSYLIIKKSVEDQSKIEMQNKFEALMKTLDYALSHTTVTGSSLPEVLQDEIYQIFAQNSELKVSLASKDFSLRELLVLPFLATLLLFLY